MRGDNILTTTASTGDFVVSYNFVSLDVQRGACMGGMFKGEKPDNSLVKPVILITDFYENPTPNTGIVGLGSPN